MNKRQNWGYTIVIFVIIVECFLFLFDELGHSLGRLDYFPQKPIGIVQLENVDCLSNIYKTYYSNVYAEINAIDTFFSTVLFKKKVEILFFWQNPERGHFFGVLPYEDLKIEFEDFLFHSKVFKKRRYKNYTIWSIHIKKTNQIFSFFYTSNYIICSSSDILIEKSIRNMRNLSDYSWKKRVKKILDNTINNPRTLYINVEKLTSLFCTAQSSEFDYLKFKIEDNKNGKFLLSLKKENLKFISPFLEQFNQLGYLLVENREKTCREKTINFIENGFNPFFNFSNSYGKLYVDTVLDYAFISYSFGDKIKQQADFDKQIIQNQFKNNLRGAIYWIEETKKILVQDISFRLYLIDQNGHIEWSLALKKAISKPHLVTYGQKNNYFFGAGNRLYLVNHLGHNINYFPLTLSPFVQIKKTFIDRDLDLTFGAIDQYGSIYKFNRQGQLLPKWSPLTMNQPILFFYKIKNINNQEKGYLIALNNGQIHYINSKSGHTYEGFPLVFHTTLIPSFIHKKDTALSENYINIINQEKEEITFNLKGKILKRDNLSADKTFSLVHTYHESFIFTRQKENQVDFLNKNGEVFLSQKVKDQKYVGFQKLPNNIYTIILKSQTQSIINIIYLNGTTLCKPLNQDTILFTQADTKKITLLAYKGKNLSRVTINNY